MYVRISEPGRVPELARFLAQRGAFVTQVDIDAVEVGFVGSLNAERQAIETQRHVQAWARTHPSVVVVVAA